MSAFDTAKKFLNPVADPAPPTPEPDPFRHPDAIATLIEHDQPIAVLIRSSAIGAPVWFALVEGWTPESVVKTPVFYPSELPHLRGKTPEQLRSIFNVKAAFGGGRVRQ